MRRVRGRLAGLLAVAVSLVVITGAVALPGANRRLRQWLARLPLPVSVWRWADALVERLFPAGDDGD